MCIHMGLDQCIFSYDNYVQIIAQINIFFSQNFGTKFIMNFPQLIHTTASSVGRKKWIKKLIIVLYQILFQTIYHGMSFKCQEFLKNTDSHFQNLEIVNIYIIKSNGNLSEKLKQYQTINHQEILFYLLHLQDEIMSSIFRAKRHSMHVKKETVMEHFKKPIKSVSRGRFLKKN